MNLHFKGKAIGVKSPIVGFVTRDLEASKGKIFILDKNTYSKVSKPLAILSNEKLNQKKPSNSLAPKVYELPKLDDLLDGDIAVVHPQGFIRTLYQSNSTHNSLFLTDRCNSNCLMCSQPPKNKEDIPYYHGINKKLINLIPKETEFLGITGGEPTLLGKRLAEMFNQIKNKLPNTEIQILTNGRLFAWQNYMDIISDEYYQKIKFAVPLYSDYPKDHDYIVQAKDAFNQTVLGLHNMARYNMRIEIRIVLHKQSIPRLFELSKYIYRNLPFVEHIAFMGLEYTGYTPYNNDLLWIDPIEYASVLEKAIIYLKRNRMNVSIYNLQLCLLPKKLWKFSRRSISDWKQTYLDECNQCAKLKECPGVFETSRKYSDNIKAII